jgi:hypothetical protein
VGKRNAFYGDPGSFFAANIIAPAAHTFVEREMREQR